MLKQIVGELSLLSLTILSGVLLAPHSATAAETAQPGQPSQDAATAMQSSIARQLAAIDASQQSIQLNSLKQQQEATKNQRKAISFSQPQTASTPKLKNITSIDGNSDFFSGDWPAAAPTDLATIQTVPVCNALATSELDKLIAGAAQKYSVNSQLIKSVISQESAFRPCAQSIAGAMGLMQIMPDTAADLGVADAYDPAQNIDGGTRFLKQMLDRYNGDVKLALSAYNAGPGRVDRAGGVPAIPETIGYVSKILGGLPLLY